MYALVVAKGGAKLRVDSKAPEFGMMGRMSNSTMSGGPMRGMVITGPRGDITKVTMSGAGIHLEASKMDMTTLTDQLTQFLERPVLDETNLKGYYQVPLDLSIEDMMNMIGKQGFPGGGQRFRVIDGEAVIAAARVQARCAGRRQARCW